MTTTEAKPKAAPQRPPRPPVDAASVDASMKLISKKQPQQPARPRLEVHYDIAKKEYLIMDQRGVYMPLGEPTMRQELNLVCNIPKKAQPGEKSEMDQELHRIRQEHSIDARGQLAGFKKGLWSLEGKKFLATTEAKLLEPTEGDWSLIRSILEPRFKTDGRNQLNYLYGLLQRRLEALYNHKRMPNQALIIAGAVNSGKTFIQDYIFTPMFGGRSANPYKWMLGETNFNDGESQSENLVIDDAPAKVDDRSRGVFGQAIKSLLAAGNVRVEPKFYGAFHAPLVQFLNILVNDTPAALRMAPSLDDSVKDKIMLMKCAAGLPMPMPTSSHEEQIVFQRAVAAQLPAFIHYLRSSFVLPDEYADPRRYGVAEYHNAEMLAALNELSGWQKLLEFLELSEVWLTTMNHGTEHSPTGWLELLCNDDLSPVRTSARLLLRNNWVIGGLFAEAMRYRPDRVSSRTLHGTTMWKFLPTAKVDEPF